MLHVSIIALLATMALAGPLTSTNLSLEDRSPSAPSSYIAACEAADNCETYIEPTTGRAKIRFKSGMEPGTDDYNSRMANSNVKRQSGYPQTQVTVGDHTIYWGCDIDPVATLGNVSSICATSGQCVETDSFSKSVTYTTPGSDSEEDSETLAITATGTYPSWFRNGLVEGIQAAMSAKGVITTSEATYVATIGPNTINGQQITTKSCQVAKAPNYIGLGVYSGPDTLEASIGISIALHTHQDGFCKMFTAIAGAIAGAFDPEGTPLAVIFGAVGATCG